MSKLKKIQADEMPQTRNNSTIIGQFEGMCADADITNENGLDITREVWENVFSSDIYKKGIELGHYIGFLGHPDDPGCQDFKDACIVMKEGHMDNDGKVYGKFDLVDTPVGRVVKSFIDAGVTFGISVRGAGDIIANSVDPDTFVFRGFDLVTFPAYKEAIPTFTEIAASTNVETQQKYKAVCAAVRNNLQSIESAAAIDLIQEQFAPQSEEYALLEDRKAELATEDEPLSAEEELDITEEQLEGVMQLYLDEKEKNAELSDDLLVATTQLKSVKASYTRKLRSLRRITAAQNADYEDELCNTINRYKTVKASSDKLKQESERLYAENDSLRSKNRILASYKAKTADLNEQIAQLKSENKVISNQNLKYKQKIEANTDDIKEKDSIIASLRTKLDETVNAATVAEGKSSNLDEMVTRLREEVSAATALVEEYQNAYASLYAGVIGVQPHDIRIASTTSVKELQSILSSSVTIGSDIDVKPEYLGEDLDDGDLITI